MLSVDHHISIVAVSAICSDVGMPPGAKSACAAGMLVWPSAVGGNQIKFISITIIIIQMNIIAASPIIMDNKQLTSLPLPDLN